MASYLVKPGTTSEDLAAQREYAQSLLANASSTKPVGHWTNILAQIAQGGLGGYELGELGNEGRRREDEAGSLFEKAIGALSGSGGATGPGGSSGTPAPAMQPSPATAAASAAGREISPTLGMGGSPLDMIKKEEGFAPVAKWDVRQYSGGYGSKAAQNETFDQPKAEQYLRRDAAPVIGWVEKNIPGASMDQKRALISFGYNLGTDDLDKLLPDMQRGDWARVGQRMLSFNQSGGAFNPGLASRRRREAALLGAGGEAPAAGGQGGGMPAPVSDDGRSQRLAVASQMYRNPTTRPMAQQIVTAEMARERKTPSVVSIDMGNGQKKSMMQMPDGSLKPIDPALMGGGENGQTPPNFEDTQKLRKEFGAQTNVKKYDDAVGPYKSMLTSAPKDTVATDLDLVYGLAKIMDPDSAVREGEFATVRNATNVPEWVKGWGQYLIEGKGKLSPGTRQQMIETARNRIGAYRQQAVGDAERYGVLAKRYGMDPGLIRREFPELETYTPPAAAPGAAPGGGTGNVIRWEDGPDGKPRRVQ